MPLSIKNEKAESLAREVAMQAGESITQAIIHALEERLERLKGSRAVADTAGVIMEISRRCSSLPDIDKRSPDQILGYDENGVPR
jgi:antitoxin VapB